MKRKSAIRYRERFFRRIPAPIIASAWSSGGRGEVSYISGTPRSGTTWVLETLLKMVNARRYWEPIKEFKWRHGRECVVSSSPTLRPWLAPELSDAKGPLPNFIKRLFANNPPYQSWRALDPKESVVSNLRRLAQTDRTLVKFTGGQQMMPWIANNIDAKGVVILRHPIATVASQMKNTTRAGNLDRMLYTAPEEVAEFLPAVRNYHGRELDRVERLAVETCVDQGVPLKVNYSSERIKFLCYEQLLQDRSLFSELASALGFNEICLLDEEEFRTPSATTDQSSNVAKGRDPRDTWRRTFSEAQIETVWRVINDFGLNFYRHDGSIDYGAFRASTKHPTF